MQFILRSWKESDVKALSKYLNNKRIWDNCRDGLPFPYTEQDATAFITYTLEQSEQNEFCIEIHDEAVGNIGFVRGTDVERFNAELGYWLAEKFWNKGVMKAALKEAIKYYFERTDVIRLFASVYEFNKASMHVLENVGFQKIGIKHKACFKNKLFIDTHYYELLR